MSIVKEIRRTNDLHILGEYAVHDDTQIRVAVAANPYCIPEYLAYMSTDESTRVLQSVVKNKNTPKEVVAFLSRKTALQEVIASNTTIHEDIISNMMETIFSEKEKIDKKRTVTPVDELKLAHFRSVALRAALNPVTDSKTLVKIAENYCKMDIQIINFQTALINNPNTTVDVLQKSFKHKQLPDKMKEKCIDRLMEKEKFSIYPREWVESIVEGDDNEF